MRVPVSLRSVRLQVGKARRAAWILRLAREIGIRLGPGSYEAIDHLVIAPPGAGNVGDQALVEAFVDNVSGTVGLICRAAGEYDLTEFPHEKVVLVPMPGLVYGTFLGHLKAMRELRGRIRVAQSLSIIGADVMDGAYNVAASRVRAAIALLLAKLDANVRVLGFSWNENPDQLCARTLDRARDAGARLFLRDPISYGRMQMRGGGNLHLAADIVFATQAESDTLLREVVDARSDRYVVVNASALVGGLIDQVGAYVSVIERLSNAGLRIVLLPHVCRPDNDDFTAVGDIAGRLTHLQNMVVASRLPSPAEVRGLVKGAEFVITGRMHLGVMALSLAVPAIIVGTQGKVEGLMEMFGIQELCVFPDEKFDAELLRAVTLLLTQKSMYVEQVSSHSDLVLRRARLNFDGMSRSDTLAIHDGRSMLQ